MGRRSLQLFWIRNWPPAIVVLDHGLEDFATDQNIYTAHAKPLSLGESTAWLQSFGKSLEDLEIVFVRFHLN